MFQESALFPWLTVRGNIELALRLDKVPKSERKARVHELLEMVHLEDFGDKRPHELSGGMRQRTALARALAQEADVLLMDEPFGALDAMTRDLLHDELEALWTRTGLTVLFVTHNVREAVRLGNRVVLLTSRPGRIAEEYPVDSGRPRRIDSVAGRRARRDHHRPTPGRGAPPWRPSKLSSPGSTPSSSPFRPRRSRASRVWAAMWPKLGAVAIALAALADRGLERLEARVRAARTGRGRSRRCSTTSATTSPPRSSRCSAPSIGFAVAVVIGTFIGAVVVAEPHPALGGRLDDHRAHDDAVDRLVPRGDRALRAQGAARSSS